MTAFGNTVGVIILGNSGVGKSFLGNVILGREAYKHRYQVNAVTIKTEYQESLFNGQTYAIYNIPGLIEAEQERIDLNKREIDVSFRQHPNAVVLYVFGTNNGRIRNEDVVAFNALNAAYPLSQKSLVVVVNGVNPNRPNDYEADTIIALSTLLKMHLPHLCFVKQICQPSETELIRQQLVQTITSAMPKIHEKMQEINLQAAEISKLTKQIAEFQKQIEQDREKHRLEVEKLRNEFEERERRQKAEQEAREWQLRAEMETRERRQKAEQEAREWQLRAEMDAKERQQRVEQAERERQLRAEMDAKERQIRAEMHGNQHQLRAEQDIEIIERTNQSIEPQAFDACRAGSIFDPLEFIKKPQVILRVVAWVFAIVVFASITQEGYVDNVCRYNGSNACGYSVAIGVIAFLLTMAFTGLDVYFPNISNIKTRKTVVLAELVTSGVLVFFWFIGFCYTTDQWRQEPDKDKDGWNGRNSVQAAIAFAFFSILVSVALTFFAFRRYREGVESSLALSRFDSC